MKLYYTPGACSMASHIVTQELGLDVEAVKVDLGTHTTETGEDYYKINPKGYIPALDTGIDGVLTEGVAILMYLADQKPESGLNPKGDGMEKYRFQELMTFISSEVHKGFTIFFGKANYTEEGFAKATERLHKRLATLDGMLEGKEFLFGENFTIADAYVFTVLNWRHMFSVDVSMHKNLSVYLEKIAARPAVIATMKAEGLME